MNAHIEPSLLAFMNYFIIIIIIIIKLIYKAP